ncbi:unnamed protein product [Vitrella brassicaformis CCMP3155]|uniref:GOLD domain-containing protein n=1 Tax=Vitrella brassicaformis (strain CCMP3155) TaxID=1169540 RepID=A0A0G4F9L2_VITBC|nr:unnamed protein product [Vitrella brassicaformis CCMP3155]|eukprot:CEM08950.1 unnamed protein product [Vitrella brassicaformis CCMP3155]
MLWQLVWVCVLLVLLVCEAIEIHVDLNASQKKCYGEELGKGTLLIAEFVTTDGLLSVNVADPSATIFSEKDKMEIKTAFTTNQAGTHMFCVQNLSRKGINVKLNIAWGAQARDYSSIAKKEHLEPMTVSLKKIEEELRLYHNIILYMREREQGLRKTNDNTAFRVIGFTLFNVALMVAVSALQIYYFRTFFRSKKII